MVEISFGFSQVSKIDNIKNFSITHWIKSEFSYEDEIYILNKISDHSFFKSYEKLGLDKLEFLEFLEKSFLAKKDTHIHNQVITKLKDMAPTEFSCDANLYANNIYYRTWFLLRADFFEKIKNALQNKSRTEKKYFVWNALCDNRSYQDCIDLHHKIFDIEESFLIVAEDHWKKARSECKCSLDILNERQISKLKLKAL